MTYNFCTLFDKNYLLKGLALYDSLLKHCPDFKLWILCMDNETHEILSKLNLEKTELISLKEFEDPKLLEVKPGRKASEYCWTCTPSLPLYILDKNSNLESITYLDADLFFFDSPEAVYREFGSDSIMIIPHNFSEEQKWREKTSGKFNVGMLIFRNDQSGLECLNWWREKCLGWCFDYYEDGKLGDQLYLNDWPERFKGVHVLKNRGANIASWNVRAHDFSKWPVIFYHFHATRLHKVFGQIKARPQNPNEKNNSSVFGAYSETINKIYKQVTKICPSFKSGIDNNRGYFSWLFRKHILQRARHMLLSLRRR